MCLWIISSWENMDSKNTPCNTSSTLQQPDMERKRSSPQAETEKMMASLAAVSLDRRKSSPADLIKRNVKPKTTRRNMSLNPSCPVHGSPQRGFSGTETPRGSKGNHKPIDEESAHGRVRLLVNGEPTEAEALLGKSGVFSVSLVFLERNDWKVVLLLFGTP